MEKRVTDMQGIVVIATACCAAGARVYLSCFYPACSDLQPPRTRCSWFVASRHHVLRAVIFLFCLTLPDCDAYLYVVLRVRRSCLTLPDLHASQCAGCLLSSVNHGSDRSDSHI
ncbi:hypothetical protein NDU88_001045 [Pleurodeles waltl]|uniref:Secreted protein n=1 Tax=Pleurodeles waltl TaxID=8319 RepID=A0AAV7TGR5_PLEWA|nr:hypothetical protein NDU88_001045 [Pleurodeles waltl]